MLFNMPDPNEAASQWRLAFCKSYMTSDFTYNPDMKKNCKPVSLKDFWTWMYQEKGKYLSAMHNSLNHNVFRYRKDTRSCVSTEKLCI